MPGGSKTAVDESAMKGIGQRATLTQPEGAEVSSPDGAARVLALTSRTGLDVGGSVRLLSDTEFSAYLCLRA
jgi:hypothetical protein